MIDALFRFAAGWEGREMGGVGRYSGADEMTGGVAEVMKEMLETSRGARRSLLPLTSLL